VGPSPGVCWDWRYGSCFNGRCGGTGDTCASQSCCSYVAPTMCCAPPFCGGNCVGSPCCL
jgi:hypothetical protein